MMDEYETTLKEMGNMNEDTQITVVKNMYLEIVELRGTSSGSCFKDGFSEQSKETRTYFHWRIKGISSKIGMDIVRSEAFNPKEQELYDVIISSSGIEMGFAGAFKTRDDAVRNALKFASINGIEIDGYRITDARPPKGTV